MKILKILSEIGLQLISLLVAIIIFNDKGEGYYLLFLYPLTFFILKICLIKYTNLFSNLTSFIIISFFFIRSVFTPVLLYLSNYDLLKNGYGIYFNRSVIKIENYDLAVLLACYEMTVIFLLLFFLNSKIKKNYKKETTKLDIKLKYFIYTLIAYIAIILIIYPELIHNFQFILNIGESEKIIKVRSLRYGGDGIPAIFLTLLNSAFTMQQIILPVYLLEKIKFKKYKTIWVISIILLLCSITNREKGNTFILLILFMITLYRTYPKYRKLINIFIVFLLFFASICLYIKSKNSLGGETLISQLSVLFSAYFSGIPNIAYSLRMERGNITNICIDFVKSIPYISGEFFKKELTSASIFNFNINGNNLYKDQILPMIGQGYFYFGYVLAPVLPSFILVLAFYYEHRMKKERNMILNHIYTYMVLYFSYSSIMLNINIFTGFLFRGLLLLILSQKIIIKKRR